MPVIASLKPKRLSPDLVVATLDSGDTVDITVESASRAGLSAGKAIGDAQWAALLAADEPLRCRIAAAAAILRRPKSRKELSLSLRRKGFGSRSIEAVLDAFAQKGLVDDAAYAEQFAEERSRRRQGRRLTEQQLQQRGIPRDQAREAAARHADPARQRADAEALLRKWNKRSKPEDPQKRRTAAAGFLVRRGFEPEMIRELVLKVMGANSGDD